MGDAGVTGTTPGPTPGTEANPVTFWNSQETLAAGLGRHWYDSVVLWAGLLLVLTPFVRPFRWSRLLFTYLIPLIPLLVLFDGTVSMLRIYQPDELRALVAGVPGQESYTWDIGEAPGLGPIHLVGTPRDESLITDPGSLILESVNP